jgi:hypothetical protein
VVAAVTDAVATVKLAAVAPPGTVTLAGTVAAALLPDSVTAAPPEGAGAFRVTVPVEGLPPPTLAGLRDTAESLAPVGGFTVIVALRVVPFNDAEIVTVFVALTEPTLTVNVALLWPVEKLRLAGTCARAESLLANSTTGQQDVTEPPRVTVAVTEPGPTTLVGFTASEETVFAAVDRNSRELTVAPP